MSKFKEVGKGHWVGTEEAMMTPSERERAEWIDEAAREIVGRFGHTFPETKEALETMNMAVPVANVIANHCPQNPAEAARREERKRTFTEAIGIIECERQLPSDEDFCDRAVKALNAAMGRQ